MTKSASLHNDLYKNLSDTCSNPEALKAKKVFQRLFFIFLLFIFMIAGQAVANAGFSEDCTLALTPDARAQDWWMPRHEEKLEDPDREDANLLFLGDSITQGWEGTGKDVWDRYYEDFGSFNIGFSGDRTEHVLWRLQNGEVDGMNPELTVLMIGTNNTGHRQDPPECTARGIEMILDELKERLPETKILMLAIFPRGETPDDPLRQLNNEINNRIQSFADNNRVYFLNINDAFLDDNGRLPESIMPDMLHPNEYGYEIWAEQMEPTLERLLSN